MRPHRRQPTRLPRPWDSPGKNTGVGCHFLLQCMKVKSESEVSQSCPTLSDPLDCSLPGSSVHGIFQARVLEWGAIAFSVYIYIYTLFFVFFAIIVYHIILNIILMLYNRTLLFIHSLYKSLHKINIIFFSVFKLHLFIQQIKQFFARHWENNNEQNWANSLLHETCILMSEEWGKPQKIK